jgi:DNA-binding transcriptional regulator YhcF (GntR family)
VSNASVPQPRRAFKLLVAIWSRHRGPKNNGRIPYSRDEACRVLQCGPNQAQRAFAELEHKGFIRLTRESHFNIKTKTAREWEITAEPTADHGAAEDFKDWRPE